MATIEDGRIKWYRQRHHGPVLDVHEEIRAIRHDLDGHETVIDNMWAEIHHDMVILRRFGWGIMLTLSGGIVTGIANILTHGVKL